MQTPGETAAPGLKGSRGASCATGVWGRRGGRAAPRERRRGAPAEGPREPAETCAEASKRKGKSHWRHTSPRAEAGPGAKEAGRGGTAEPEGGTDGRDHGQAGGVEEGGWEGLGTAVETAPLHPNPATVANTAGEAVPGARAGSPSPRGSLPTLPPSRRSPSRAHVARMASLASTPHSAHNWRAPGPSALTGRFSAGSPTQYPVEISWGFWKAISSHSLSLYNHLIPPLLAPPPQHATLSSICCVPIRRPSSRCYLKTERVHFGNNVNSHPHPHPIESRARYFLDLV